MQHLNAERSVPFVHGVKLAKGNDRLQVLASQIEQWTLPVVQAAVLHQIITACVCSRLATCGTASNIAGWGLLQPCVLLHLELLGLTLHLWLDLARC